MKSESPGSHSRMRLSSAQLDPLEVNELIVEQRLFLPLLAGEGGQPRPHPVIFKITRDKTADRIVIFLLSEVDLYFLYRFDLSHELISDLNGRYKLSLKRLADLVELLRGSLEEVRREEKQAVLELSEEGVFFVVSRQVGGRLHTVLELLGRPEPQEVVQMQVAYRYGALRERIARKEERIAFLRETVRQKYPHLLKNFKQI